MMNRQRMTFQLTPLLDLLLIVIFAQYMEVQNEATSAQSKLQEERSVLEQQFRERTTDLEKQFAAKSEELEATRRRYSKHYESIVRQHQQAGSALASALNLPGTLMEQVLRLRADGNVSDAENLQEAIQRMRDQISGRGAEMLEFILRYDEMQKHVSVWEIYLNDGGQVLFSDGENAETVVFRTMDEFASRCFEVSKSFSEPKPLVIILLTHGDAQAGLRRKATQGMTPLVEQLRKDAGNTRWFDFSLMGFRPNGPLFAKLPQK